MRMQKWGKCARQNGALFSEYRWNGVMTLLTFLPATPPLGPEPLFPYPSPLVFLNSSIFPTNIGGQFHQLLIFDSRIPPPQSIPSLQSVIQSPFRLPVSPFRALFDILRIPNFIHRLPSCQEYLHNKKAVR